MEAESALVVNSLPAQELLADLVCWTAGSMPSSKAGQNPMKLPFPSNDKGATQTETTLRVASHARVFALGDVSTMDPSGPVSNPQLPPTAQVASFCEQQMLSNRGTDVALALTPLHQHRSGYLLGRECKPLDCICS